MRRLALAALVTVMLGICAAPSFADSRARDRERRLSACHPGLGLRGSSEATAVSQALADCAKRDSDCRVIAIGPFSVEPN